MNSIFDENIVLTNSFYKYSCGVYGNSNKILKNKLKYKLYI